MPGSGGYISLEGRKAVSQIGQLERLHTSGATGPRSLGARQGAEDFAGTDRFLVQRRLGAGAYGVVYEAYDRREKSLVALKVLRFAEADSLYRFKKGFRALADIRHPNLVSFYELLSQDGLWFFSMELVPGRDFLEALTAPEVEPQPSSTDFRPPDFELVRGTSLQLAKGLHTLHLNGKVHRDIKPPNVLVTDDARTVLLDFGLVTELQRIGLPEAEPLTVGTPAYMSPEQALALPGSAASDWYSVGVMLYQALAGELPFQGTTLEILAGKQTGTPPPLAGMPGDLEELCFGLLDPDPETRLQGAQVLDLLERASGTPQFRLRASGATAAARIEPSAATVGEPPAPGEVEAPFIGRAKILGELEAALAASRDGTETVYLRGASGMGKSALIERFIARLAEADDQAVVLAGRCYLQESVPYKALDSLIDALSRFLMSLPGQEVEALLPAEVGPLSRLFPVLRRVGSMDSGDFTPLEPHQLRRQASAGLRELLRRLADRHALVLVIDDLHWGDLDSFQVLDEILKPPDPPHLLLLGAYRREDEPASPFLRALAGHREALRWRGIGVRELEIDELSADEAQDLIGALAHQGLDIPPTRAAGILREAGGNPLFLSELARFPKTAAGSVSDVDLRDVITNRVEALPPPARRLLEVVAVAGKPLELEVAREAAATVVERASGATAAGAAGLAAAATASEAPESLALLRTSKLIRQVAGSGREELETYHDRIRSNVVERLSASALRGYHRALALALESSGSGDPETLAVHFEATEEVAQARRYAVAAAARAEQALAFERAARLYRLALELEGGEGEERYRLQLKLGEALANAGRSREAAETFLQAVGQSGIINPIEAQRHAAEKLLISGHIDRGMAILRHVLRTTGMRLERRSWRALVNLWWHRLRLRLRGLEFEETAPADCDPQALQRIDTCWSVEVGLCLVDVLRASQFHARHLLLALEAGEPERVARGLAMEVFFGSMEGAGGGQTLERARRLAGRLGARYPASLTEMASGMLACSQGRWSEAHRCLKRAEGQLREARTGTAWELDTVRHFDVLALLQLGRWPELFAELPGLLGPAREQGNLYLEIHLRHWVESFRHLVDDRPDAARETLAETLDSWSHEGFHFQHFGHLYASAQVALYEGRGARAWELVNRGWGELTGSMIQRIEMVLIFSHDLRARCALAAAAEASVPPEGGKWNNVPEGDRRNSAGRRSWLLSQAESSARTLERAGSSWPAGLAGLLRAGIADLRGRRDTTLAHLENAAADFEASDMPVHAAIARWSYGRLFAGTAAAEERVLDRLGVRDRQRLAAVFSPGWIAVAGEPIK